MGELEMARRIKAYYGRDAAEVRVELVSTRNHLRKAHACMPAEEFRSYLHAMELDEATARDWLASDGCIGSITNRMLPYFLLPVAKALSA
jgi:hypothetical protein